jgi:hypothetical protein
MSVRSSTVVRLGVPAVLAALFAASAQPVLAASHRTRGTASPSAQALAFGHETVVDSQRVTGEPSLAISPVENSGGHHDIYVSTPFGFLTTASFIWKSEDGGQSFHLVAAQQPPLGKPDTCIGGGDSNVVTDQAGDLFFTDLQGLTNVSGSVSTDGGRSFTTTCNQANETLTDRPWISVYGDPLTTGREYMTVDDVEQCSPLNCSLGQAGSNLVELTQASGQAAQEQIFSPLPAQQIEPDGIVSGTVVDQRTGDLYIAHTGYTDPQGRIQGGSDGNGNDNAVVVDRFPGGFDESSPTPIPPGSVSLCKPYNPAGPCDSETAFSGPLTTYQGSQYSAVTVGQDFSPLALDTAGDLYVVWAQAPVSPKTGAVDGPGAIYMAVSTDQGRTWGPPIDVSGAVPGLDVNVFPAVAAGAPGKVDIVWYGADTPLSEKQCSSSSGCGSSAVQAPWNVYMAQTLDAVTSAGQPNPHPSFEATKVTEYPNHYGAICTMGVGCSTGGDRGLLDFIEVQIVPSGPHAGAAEVVWADSANTDGQGSTSSAIVAFARQVSGPGLYGGSIDGPAPAYGAGQGSPDAYYSANGAEASAPANLQIEASSISGPDSAGNYTITMRLRSLNTLSDPTMGGPVTLWLTRFEAPAADPSFADQGHIYYAAMESDGGGPPSFYAGQTSALAVPSDTAFFLTYPPQDAVSGTYSPGAPGTITITVPAGDFGGYSGPLYSATGITATELLPASTGAGVFNQIDATEPYDTR